MHQGYFEVAVVQRGASNIWFNMPGVVAAYQAIAAPSQLASYQNVGQGRLGTFTAAPGVAPTWSPVTGWAFNGTTQWLRTNMIGADNASLLIRYNGATNTSSQRIMFGSRVAIGARFYLYTSYINQVVYGHQGALIVAPGLLAGVLGFAGQQGYRNGNKDGGIITTDDENYVTDMYIGCVFYENQPQFFWDGNIQAILVALRPLTAAEVWLASKQMAYCEQNPDWNAWAPRRRYWIIAPAAAAGRVGIYGRRGALALSGGVQIKSVGGGM